MKIKLVSFLVLMCIIGAGCGSDSASSGTDRAQAIAGGSAQLRIGCMLLPLADFSLDGDTLIANMVYPYISDYQTVSAGKHTLHVTAAAGSSGPEASIDLDLEPDHYYLVVSYGNIAAQSDHALLLVDETEAVMGIADDHNAIRFMHLLSSTPGLDGYIDGEQQMDNLTYGTTRFFVAPTGEFQVGITPSGMPNLKLYEDIYQGLPQTYTVVVALGTLFNPKLYMSVYTPLDMLSFFNHLSDTGGYYDETRALLTSSEVINELAGPGPLTVFAPWDSTYVDPAFSDIPDVRDDPAQLAEAMRYYIVPDNVPPYMLYHRSELPTLQGTPLSVSVEPDDSPSRPHFWLNGSVRVYQDYRTRNGVLYELDGLLTPFNE